MTKSICKTLRIVSLGGCLIYLRVCYDIGALAHIAVILVAFIWGLVEHWEGLVKQINADMLEQADRQA